MVFIYLSEATGGNLPAGHGLSDVGFHVCTLIDSEIV